MHLKQGEMKGRFRASSGNVCEFTARIRLNTATHVIDNGVDVAWDHEPNQMDVHEANTHIPGIIQEWLRELGVNGDLREVHSAVADDTATAVKQVEEFMQSGKLPPDSKQVKPQ